MTDGPARSPARLAPTQRLTLTGSSPREVSTTGRSTPTRAAPCTFRAAGSAGSGTNRTIPSRAGDNITAGSAMSTNTITNAPMTRRRVASSRASSSWAPAPAGASKSIATVWGTTRIPHRRGESRRYRTTGRRETRTGTSRRRSIGPPARNWLRGTTPRAPPPPHGRRAQRDAPRRRWLAEPR